MYSPDILSNSIVKIDVTTGIVTHVVTLPDPLDTPIAVKVASDGTLYYIGRKTGNVYKFQSGVQSLITNLNPALDNLSLSLDETKLYVTNDQNQIFEVKISNGQTKILFQSPIVQPWDLAFDPETNSLYVADFGSLKDFDATTGDLNRILKAGSADSPIGNSGGQIAGITVEEGPDAKIIMTDNTQGVVMVVDKDTFELYDVLSPFCDQFNANCNGLLFNQPLSTVRVTGGSPSEYYLATDPVNGKIIKFFRDPITPDNSGVIIHEDFFVGLLEPVKLKLHNGFVYVVEAGDLLNFKKNGKVSRIPLNNSTQREILLDKLHNPQGLDIFNNKILVLEAGKKRLLESSATSQTKPKVVRKNLNLSNDILIYELAPIPINPFTGIATSPSGHKVFINQTQPDNILLLFRN